MKIDIDINEKYESLSILIKAPKMNKEVSQIIDKLNNDDKKMMSISGKIDDKIYVLNPSDIMIFTSYAGKVYAQTKDKELEIKQTLYALEESFSGTSFIRISKSAIVNINKIKNVEVSFNGSLVVKMLNGHQEMISRRFVSKFKKFINIGGNYE
jgi:DNA-binding LytR/AlgR family response regulator